LSLELAIVRLDLCRKAKAYFYSPLLLVMKANCNYLIPSKTETIDREAQTKFFVAKPSDYAKIIRFLQNLFASLLRGNELQVKQRRDRQGNIWWQAFDPNTDESASFGSEAEMRSWIEQRYYR